MCITGKSVQKKLDKKQVNKKKQINSVNIISVKNTKQVSVAN